MLMPTPGRLSTLHRLLLSSATDSESIQRALLEAVLDDLRMQFGVIAHIDGDSIVPGISISKTGTGVPEWSFDHQHLAGMMLETGKTVASDDGSFVGTPIGTGDEVRLLWLTSEDPRAQPFSEDDFTYIEVLAAILARGLHEQQLADEIAHLRLHDRVTGLPLETRMRERIAASTAAAPEHAFAVCAVDIDLPRIIEQYDYEISSRLIGFAAARLQAINDNGSVAYRGTSCDFFIVSDKIESVRDAKHVANRIQTAFATPFTQGGNDVIAAVSVGVALFPDDAPDGESVVASAVASVKRAKAQGKSQPLFSASERPELHDERRALATRLKNAIESDELVLHYQPYIDLESREVVGAEALVRWRMPDGSLVQPDDFLPLVEGTDAMLSLGSWVMGEAARVCRRLQDERREMTIAFNVSPSQLQDAGFFQRLKLAIAAAGVSPALLEIEITESAALSDPIAARELLLECRRLGLKIALDDFGTGYSSLVYLRRLPADVVKIDRSFVGALPNDPDCGAISGSIVALAHRLGRLVQAEGIENEAQWNWLRAEGCDLAQGFHISYPLSETELFNWLPAYEHSVRPSR